MKGDLKGDLKGVCPAELSAASAYSITGEREGERWYDEDHVTNHSEMVAKVEVDCEGQVDMDKRQSEPVT